MSTPAELIQVVEAAGGRFLIDRDRLGIVPEDAAALVIVELRRQKAEVIAELSQRLQVPDGAWLVRYAPKPPPIRLSESETVVDTEKFIVSTLRELAAHLRREKFLDGGWGRAGLLHRLAVCGCHVVIDDPRKALQ